MNSVAKLPTAVIPGDEPSSHGAADSTSRAGPAGPWPNHHSAAVAQLRNAAALRPEDPDCHFRLGHYLQMHEDLQGARECYRKAIELNPRHAESFCNLGALCSKIGDLTRAENFYRYSISIDQSPDAYCGLGEVAFKQAELSRAIECVRKALALNPGHIKSLCSLGYLLQSMGDFEGSRDCYRIALSYQPDSSLASFALAVSYLTTGELELGWPGYEKRWDTPELAAYRRDFTQPRWTGEAVDGKRILVHAEQGLGDTIQFVRYVPMLAELGAKVILEIQPPLLRLFGDMPGVERVLSRGDALPEFDFHCPLLSLPLAFKTTLATIPARVPYASASPKLERQWARRIRSGGTRVGIVWSGNPKHGREQFRTIPVSQLARLADIRGTKFYSLQKGPQVQSVRMLPKDLPVDDLGEEQRDFADTAAIVKNLDLVISIDTSVAHLAGAMGKRVWILLDKTPDWRWLIARQDTPWYPTARLFRQNELGNWGDVVRQLRSELEVLTRIPGGGAGSDVSAPI